MKESPTLRWWRSLSSRTCLKCKCVHCKQWSNMSYKSMSMCSHSSSGTPSYHRLCCILSSILWLSRRCSAIYAANMQHHTKNAFNAGTSNNHHWSHGGVGGRNVIAGIGEDVAAGDVADVDLLLVVAVAHPATLLLEAAARRPANFITEWCTAVLNLPQSGNASSCLTHSPKHGEFQRVSISGFVSFAQGIDTRRESQKMSS